MPGIDQETIKPENQDDADANNQENKEVKPLTLTDHLNKKLLNSFLARINSNDSQVNGMLNDLPTKDENETDFN